MNLKIILPTLFPIFGFAASAADPMVDCRIAQAQACQNCGERIQASCSDANLNGAFDRNYRPSKVELKIVNHANGTERIVSVANSKFNFADLQSADKVAGLARHSGIKLGRKETVEVFQVYVLTAAKFFKNTEGAEVTSLGNPTSAARSIASETGAAPKAGGVGRAQQMATKHTNGKDSK